MSIVVDYVHRSPAIGQVGANGFSDPLGFGIEVETGGHVFYTEYQQYQGYSEINSLSGSQTGRGQFRIGFTMSCMFDFNHKG